MPAPAPLRILPPLPPALRYVIGGCVIAMLVYGMTLLEPAAPKNQPDETPPAAVVPVPVLDSQILAGALDSTREQRLLLDAEPLRHLLAKAIDVGPTVAAALGIPDRPVAVAEVRAQPERFRHRWLWYEGQLEELSGAREGHPIRGYSIFEATVKLADGNRVPTPPGAPVLGSVR